MQDTPSASSAHLDADADARHGASALRKIHRRFIPLLFVCFVVAFLDRVNVGFAALTMNRDLGLSATAYGLGAGLFFLTYFAFELPSNLALQRFGARRWIARIMFSWGLISGAMAFVWNEASFHALRLLLGAAEAGFFPGIIFFLSRWVPAASRARMIAVFMAAMPVASVIGAPLSGLLMQLDGLAGLRGWQWMFLIEALPALLLVPVVLQRLSDSPDSPDTTRWLTDAERGWLVRTLATEAARHRAAGAGHARLPDLLRSPLVWGLGAAYFGLTGFNYGLSFFLPQIVKQFGFTVLQTGFVAAIPFAVAAAGMSWWGRRSDRCCERRLHLLAPMAVAALGLVAATLVQAPWLQLLLLSLAAFGVFSALPIYWTLPPAVLPVEQAAAGIAIVNSLGNLSGFVNPYAVGAIRDATGGFAGGLQLIALFGVVGWTLLLFITRGGDWSAGPRPPT